MIGAALAVSCRFIAAMSFFFSSGDSRTTPHSSAICLSIVASLYPRSCRTISAGTSVEGITFAATAAISSFA